MSVVYTVLSIIALIAGTLWIITNFYQYYPVIQSKVLTFATQTRTRDAVFLAQDDTLNELTEKARRVPDDLESIPTIDVFVPAYKEAEILHQSIKSIHETTYPRSALNIYLLLEPDDKRTQNRATELANEYDFTELIIPEDYPGAPNKPRALNYAFEHSDGDIVGVMDAENIIEPDLFDRVAAAIIYNDLDYLQGLVDMVNESDGWLNLLFRAEYGFWYRIIVPAFHRLDFPIPLSGTTCFFRRKILEEVSELRYQRGDSPWGIPTPQNVSETAEAEIVREHVTDGGQTDGETDGGQTDGGNDYLDWFEQHDMQGFIPWDPANVTEDFELGLLLWAYDCDFGLINSVTREESPRDASTWLKQRTRWQKGKLYTFLNFLRTPVDSPHKQSHVLWQSFLPHLGPLNIVGILLLVFIGFFIGFIPELFLIVGVLSIGFVFLVVSVFAYVAGYWFASTESLETSLARSFIVLFTAPVYWVFQWAADIRASKQLLSGNLSWEKTLHKDADKFEDLHQVDAKPDRDLTELIHSYITSNRYLIPLLFVAIATRLPKLSSSLWLDEAYTVVLRGSQSVFGIITTVEPHPPLYYLLVSGWMWTFGNSEIATRSLSLLFGLSTIVAVYFLAARLYNTETGIYVALLFTVSTMQVQYSQMARMYALEMFLTVISLHFYLLLLNRQTLETKFAYGLSTVALLYTHIYGVFIVLAQLLHLAIHIYRHGSEMYEPALSVIKVAVTASLAFAPWILGMLVPNYLLSSGQGAASWLEQPTASTLRNIFYAYAGAPVNYPVLRYEGLAINMGRLFILGFIGGVGYLVIRLILPTTVSEFLELNKQSRDYAIPQQMRSIPSATGGTYLALTVLISVLIVPYGISQAFFPILDVRYALIGYIGVALLLIRPIMVLPKRKSRVIAVCLLLVLMTPGLLGYYETNSVEPWEELTHSFDDDISEDMVMYNPEYAELPTSYYLEKQDKNPAATIAYTNNSSIKALLGNTTFEHIWVVTYVGKKNQVHPLLSAQYRKTNKISKQNLKLIKYTHRSERVETTETVKETTTTNDETTTATDKETTITNNETTTVTAKQETTTTTTKEEASAQGTTTTANAQQEGIVIENVSASNVSVEQGESFTVMAIIANVGNDDQGAQQISYRIGGNVIEAQLVQVPAESEKMVTFNVSLGAFPTGIFTAGVFVDGSNQTTTLTITEGNNSGYSTSEDIERQEWLEWASEVKARPLDKK